MFEQGTGAGGDSGGAGATDYQLIGTSRTFRVNADQSTTPVVNVTAQSVRFGVQYTWTMLAKTWDAGDGPSAIATKTQQVNAICEHAHVQNFRTEQDQGPSQQLYNYAVITVGTDDQAITDDTRIRMDHIAGGAALAAVDTVWARLVAAGAS